MNISFLPQQRICSANLSYRSNANSPKNSLDNTGNIKRRNVINKNSMSKASGGKFKRNNILENLMKQKENLMNNKNALRERCLQNDEDPRTIKEKLQSIDKQIEEIDKQVSELQLEEQRKAIGTEDKNKKGKNSKQKSNKDYPNVMKTAYLMDSVLNLSTDLKKAKALSSQKNLISGEARVLDFEIQIDINRGINPIAKKKYLAKMKDNIEKITEKLGNHLKDVNTKISNNTQSNYSNDIVDKNEQSRNADISGKPKAGDKSLIKQQQVAQNIKHYKDNIKNKVKDSCEKINIIA
jgi:hypothetical protein